MALGLPTIPVNPEDVLAAQQFGVAASAQPAPAAKIPMQVGGAPVLMDQATGAITAPDITTTTTTGGSSGGSRVPETDKIKAAEENQAETRQMAEAAQQKLTAAKLDEQTFRAEQAERQTALLQQQMDDQAKLRAAEDAKVTEALTGLRARQQEQQGFKPETYRESMGTFRQALAAIGVGLGQYSSAINGTPNTAFQIFQAGEQAHQAKQRALIEQKAKAVEDATGNLQLANETRNKAFAALNEQYLLKNKYLQNLIEAKIARIPKVAAEGQAELAKLRADHDKTEMDTAKMLAGTKTWEGPKTSTTTVGGKPSATTGGRLLPGARDIEAAATAEVMEGKANKLDELTKQGFAPTPAQVAEVHNNELQFLARQHKESASVWQNLIGQIGRGANVFPDSIFPKNMKQETREWIRHQRDLWHSEAVALYGLGWLSTPENYAHVAEARAPKIGDTQADILEKGEVTSKQAHIQNRLFHEAGKTWRQADMVEASKAVAERGAPAPAGEAPKPHKRDFAQERRDIARAQSILKSKTATAKQKRAAQIYLDQGGE